MMQISRLHLFGLLTFLVVCGFSPAYAELKIERAMLNNGMEIVVIPNHKVPALSHMVWFRVGAIDDPQGKSGLAHFHEHMMFQGTTRYPNDSYSTTIRALGGEKNAFTSKDFTGYMINIAKEHLATAMELEADRMMNLNPPEQEFLRERKVIIEERKMVVDSNPAAQLNEQMDAALYRNHPYGVPVIGWLHEMQGLDQKDVMNFHRRYYHAANAFVLITGDVTMDEVLPLAKNIYGRLPAGEKVMRQFKAEPPQNVERRLTLRHSEAKKPIWVRTYSVDSIGVGDKTMVYPLNLLSQVLGEGTSSRLYQSLVVEQKIALSAASSYNGFSLGSGEFTLQATPAEGVSIEALERAVENELTKLAATPPTAEELQTAKTLFAAGMVYARDSLQALNYITGSMMASGLPVDSVLHMSAEVNALSQADVMKAYGLLDRDASVTGVLLPKVIR